MALANGLGGLNPARQYRSLAFSPNGKFLRHRGNRRRRVGFGIAAPSAAVETSVRMLRRDRQRDDVPAGRNLATVGLDRPAPEGSWGGSPTPTPTRCRSGRPRTSRWGWPPSPPPPTARRSHSGWRLPPGGCVSGGSADDRRFLGRGNARGKGRLRRRLRPGRVSSRLSPDGRTLAVGCRGGVCRLADAATAASAELGGHRNFVFTMAFSRDGVAAHPETATRSTRATAARSSCGTSPHAANCGTLHTRDRNGIMGVAFSPDGKMLAAVTADGTLMAGTSRSGRERSGRAAVPGRRRDSAAGHPGCN